MTNENITLSNEEHKENADITNNISIEDFMKIDLRVAQVLSVEPIPKSSKLYKLKVSLGTLLGERQILSGIAKHYTPEGLIGKRVIIVSNLQPAKMMGEESQGMLLAGSNEDNTILHIIEPHSEIELGCRVR